MRPYDASFAANLAAMQQVTGIAPYTTSGNYMDISYQPTITWQDTTSAATYTSASSVLNS